jgi:hypothetical protein
LKGVIELTQKTLDPAVKEVPPSQVLDFSFATKAARSDFIKATDQS